MRTCILDLGSTETRLGDADAVLPSIRLPTVLGRAGAGAHALVYFGREAMKKRGVLSLTYPVRRATLENVKDVQLLLEYALDLHTGKKTEETITKDEVTSSATSSGSRSEEEIRIPSGNDGVNVTGAMVSGEGGGTRRSSRSTTASSRAPGTGVTSSFESSLVVDNPAIGQNGTSDTSRASMRLLWTEAPRETRAGDKSREQNFELAFEGLSLGGAQVGSQGVLPLLGSGRTSGCVVTCGEGLSHIVCTVEEFVQPRSTKVLEVAGHDITEEVLHALRDQSRQGLSMEIAAEAKEKFCTLLSAGEAGLEFGAKRKYLLPDGSSVSLGAQWKECADILFEPTLIDVESEGLHILAQKAIQECPMDYRRSLYGDIVLTGGTTLLEGFPQELWKRIHELIPASINLQMHAPPHRKQLVWIGGAVLASLSSFESLWVTNEEWKEAGRTILDRKCV